MSKKKKERKTAERHWISEKPADFRDVLNSERKAGNVLHWGEVLSVSKGEEKLWIPSKLIVRFD